jgi:hypothetical protein
MKTIRIASAVALGLALLVGLSALTAAAAGPTGVGPSAVMNLDNLRHTVPADGSLWFRFGYTANETGEEANTTLRMVNGNRNGLSFEVWMPDVISNWPNTQAIGTGTPYAVDCNTGLASAQGGCESNDLVWSGTLESSGTYYVRVTNTNPFGTRILLTVKGQGLNLKPQTIPATGANAVPTTPEILVNVDDPAKSFNIDSQRHMLAPKAGVWYRFDYSVSDTGDRPVKTIRLVNGNDKGLSFEVWTAENLNEWWNNQPIGRGTTYQVDCNTGEIVGNTGCQSKDLIWAGAFGTSGTYYIRVYNDNLQPTPFDVTIQ